MFDIGDIVYSKFYSDFGIILLSEKFEYTILFENSKYPMNLYVGFVHNRYQLLSSIFRGYLDL